MSVTWSHVQGQEDWLAVNEPAVDERLETWRLADDGRPFAAGLARAVAAGLVLSFALMVGVAAVGFVLWTIL